MRSHTPTPPTSTPTASNSPGNNHRTTVLDTPEEDGVGEVVGADSAVEETTEVAAKGV
ncbi:MAG: hypothetical protein ACK2U9_13520 [Anaerolineae bacterium]